MFSCARRRIFLSAYRNYVEMEGLPSLVHQNGFIMNSSRVWRAIRFCAGPIGFGLSQRSRYADIGIVTH